jgi:hypothetical protein
VPSDLAYVRSRLVLEIADSIELKSSKIEDMYDRERSSMWSRLANWLPHQAMNSKRGECETLQVAFPGITVQEGDFKTSQFFAKQEWIIKFQISVVFYFILFFLNSQEH